MHDDKSAIQSETATRDDVRTPSTVAARRVTSADLFNGARELEIEHNGRRYQLRITQTGKLILTA